MNKPEFVDYLKNLLSFVTKNAEDDAQKLADSFGAFTYMMHLDKYVMQEASGCSMETADFLKLAAAITARRVADEYKSGRKYSQKAVEDYIGGLFFGLSVETVYMLMFDADGKFISSERIGDGTVNATGFIPRKLLDIAIRKKAKSVVIAHNHPCGRIKASDNDIKTTYVAKNVLESSGIELISHYIVSGFEICDCIELLRDSESR